MSNVNDIESEWNSALLELIDAFCQLNSRIAELESKQQILHDWIVHHEAWNHTDRGTLEKIEAWHKQQEK
jgi:hypothetical protein